MVVLACLPLPNVASHRSFTPSVSSDALSRVWPRTLILVRETSPKEVGFSQGHTASLEQLRWF